MTVKGPPPGKFILKLKFDSGKLVPMEKRKNNMPKEYCSDVQHG